LYQALCNFKTEWFTLDEFIDSIDDGIYNKKTTQKILDSSKIKIDNLGGKNKIFKINRDEEEPKYSIDLTAVIKYTELKS
jgi:hypothetical protein